MFSHQPPDSAPRSRLFARIDAKTSERYWLIFWIQLGLTIAAYLYINSNSAYILFAVVCVLWIQFVLIELALVPLLVMHELGHASVAKLLGVKVSKIVIGVGKTIGSFQIFNIPYIIAQFPLSGMVELYQKSFEFYRFKHFLISFAGPLTHILLALLLWKTQLSFKWYLTQDAFIDLISCLTIANSSLLLSNLWPYSQQEVNEHGIETELQTDGLQMIKAPFLSDREIANSIASIHLIEGWEYLEEKQYHQAIKSFHAALAIDPQLVRAYQGMALIYQYLLDYAEAIENFSHVIELNISSVLAYLYRGK
jgi:Zn-dependent protease